MRQVVNKLDGGLVVHLLDAAKNLLTGSWGTGAAGAALAAPVLAVQRMTIHSLIL